jgi:hypothetical protein
MPINPWVTTQLLPKWTIPLVSDTGMAADLTTLSASNITLMMKNISSGVERTATGAVTILGAPTNGVITFAPSVADVALAGMYEVRVEVAFAGGTEPFLLGIWDVAPK